MWNWRKKNRNQIIINPIPMIDLKLKTKTVKIEKELYIEPTDKEIIKGLEFCDNYEAAFRIKELKKEVANLKRKLTILTKNTMKPCDCKDQKEN